jgi:hypothetical protein
VAPGRAGIMEPGACRLNHLSVVFLAFSINSAFPFSVAS